MHFIYLYKYNECDMIKKNQRAKEVQQLAEEKTGGTPATKAKNKYNAKAYDQFLVTVPTGQKAEIDKEAKKQGYKSRNEFIVAAIEEKKAMG